MAEQRERFATELINEAVKQRNHWRLAFIVSLAGNVILTAMLIFR